jgi:hypothetical protein
VLGGLNDLHWLISKPFGEILMTPLHPLMRHVELVFARVVRAICAAAAPCRSTSTR